MAVVSASEASDESSGGGKVFDNGGANLDAVLLLAFASLPCPFLPTPGLQQTCQCHQMLQTHQGRQALSRSTAVACRLLHSLLQPALYTFCRTLATKDRGLRPFEHRHSHSCSGSLDHRHNQLPTESSVEQGAKHTIHVLTVRP